MKPKIFPRLRMRGAPAHGRVDLGLGKRLTAGSCHEIEQRVLPCPAGQRQGAGRPADGQPRPARRRAERERIRARRRLRGKLAPWPRGQPPPDGAMGAEAEQSGLLVVEQVGPEAGRLDEKARRARLGRRVGRVRRRAGLGDEAPAASRLQREAAIGQVEHRLRVRHGGPAAGGRRAEQPGGSAAYDDGDDGDARPNSSVRPAQNARHTLLHCPCRWRPRMVVDPARADGPPPRLGELDVVGLGRTGKRSGEPEP